MHMNYTKSFTTLNIGEHERDKYDEKYPCAPAFYRGGDRTRMNAIGYRALRRIVDGGMGLA